MPSKNTQPNHGDHNATKQCKQLHRNNLQQTTDNYRFSGVSDNLAEIGFS